MPNPALTPSILHGLLAGLSRTIARGAADDPAAAETAAALLAAFNPETPVQAMLAAQAVALHHAAVDCFGRAMQTDPEDHTTATRLHRNAASLTRAFTATLHTLHRCQVAAAQATETGQQDLMHREQVALSGSQPAPEPSRERQNGWNHPVQRERRTEQAPSEPAPPASAGEKSMQREAAPPRPTEQRSWEQLTEAEQFAILYPERVAAGATSHEDADLWLARPDTRAPLHPAQ